MAALCSLATIVIEIGPLGARISLRLREWPLNPQNLVELFFRLSAQTI
jgi:hypothetical protein